MSKEWVRQATEAYTDEDEDCDSCDRLKLFRRDIRRPLPRTFRRRSDTASDNTTQNGDETETQTTDDDFWEMEPPPDFIDVGHAGWTILHTLAAYYPENPSETKQEETRQFLHSFSRVYPCKICADDFSNILRTTPPDLTTRPRFALWMCQAHNKVNQRLGKPDFPCDRVDERWRVPKQFNHDAKEA